MKWGDKMQTISIYRDEQCKQLISSGFVGEYTQIEGSTPTINQKYRTITVDGKSVRFAQLWSFYRSTVADDDATEIELPVDLESTNTTTKQIYIYFTPRSRVVLSSEKRTDARYIWLISFEILVNNTWIVCTEPSSPYIRNYSTTKPYKLVFRTGDSARYNGNVPIDATDFFGIDIISYDQQGREEPYRGAIIISPFQSFLIAGDVKPYKPKTGNTTKRAGSGTGYYPNSRIPALPTNAINAAFSSVLGVGNGLTYYKLSGDCLSAITEFLYDTTLTLKFRNSEYRDSIASLVFIPYNVQPDRINTKRTIYLANKGIYPNDSCDFITTPLREIDFGEINLTAETVGYKTFADFTLTTATLYLPCYGAVNLDMHSIANGILHLRAVIDVRNGNILYRLETQSGVDDLPVLYGQYSGNCGIPVPVGGANAGATLLGAVSSIGTVATGIATGNPLSIVGGVSALAQQTAPTIDKSGALQPAAAAYGTPVPVLQIMKKIMLAPPEWGSVNGFLSGGKDGDTEYTLSDFSGYFRAAACDVSGIDGATEQEKQQIKNLLETGVYL